MKNYKNLVPIGLVVFMGVGIYSVFANAATENSDYHAYLKKARRCQIRGDRRSCSVLWESIGIE